MKRACTGIGLLAGLLASSAGCRTESAAAESPRASGPVTVRLATWNVRKCEAGLENVIAELRELDADVLCLQELIEPPPGTDGVNQTREIAGALGMHCYSHGGRLDAPRRQCLAILSRTPLSQAEALFAVPHRSYGITAVTPWGGRNLRIVCVHLAGTYRLDWEHIRTTRHERVLDWRALARQSGQWAEPMIVAGDFNTTPGTPEFEQFASKLDRAEAGPTFPSGTPWLALDHVFHSGVLAAGAVKTADSRLSDHRPIVVELNVGGVSELRTPNS